MRTGVVECISVAYPGCVLPAHVLHELAGSRLTERGATRADDRVSDAAMEDRKKEGYF